MPHVHMTFGMTLIDISGAVINMVAFVNAKRVRHTYMQYR